MVLWGSNFINEECLESLDGTTPKGGIPKDLSAFIWFFKSIIFCFPWILENSSRTFKSSRNKTGKSVHPNTKLQQYRSMLRRNGEYDYLGGLGPLSEWCAPFSPLLSSFSENQVHNLEILYFCKVTCEACLNRMERKK